jgi:antitoxin CcdA
MRMKYEAARSPTKVRTVATNISLDADLVAEARKLGINISRASTAGLKDAVARARAERWLQENGAALDSSNAFVDACGLPLHSLRQF